MRVILTQEMPNLGPIGQVVGVKDGYARNYLIPRGFAVVANESNEKELNHKKRVLAKKREKLLTEFKKTCQALEKLTLSITKQVGEDERIFGTVTTAEVAELIEKEGIQVSKKEISFQEEIKKIGVYTAHVRLHTEVTAKVKVWVVAPQPA